MKKHSLTYLVALFAFMSDPTYGTILHVPGDYPTIQAALYASNYQDVVEVACGTYYEHDIELASTVTVRSATGDPACVTIDAQGLGRVFNAQVVTEVALAGLTITGAFPGFVDGGGLSCFFSDVTITDCNIHHNDAGVGGGLACQQSTVMVERCTFSENTSTNAGTGLWFAYGTVSLVDCIIRDHTGSSTNSGATIFSSVCELSLVRCQILNNNAVGVGGIDARNFASIHLTDCTFAENHARTATFVGWGFGGGLNLLSGITATIQGCTFSGNHADEGGGAIVAAISTVQMTDNRFIGNRARLGGAIYSENESPGSLSVQSSLFFGNEATELGGVMYSWHSSPSMSTCTLVANSAAEGSGLFGEGLGNAQVDHCIIAFGTVGSSVGCSDNFQASLSCTDIFGNAGGDWIGCVAGEAGANGNQSADPQFCFPASGDFTLQADSPCLPPGSGTCGVIGAFGLGCGPTSVESTSWGRIKGLYRE